MSFLVSSQPSQPQAAERPHNLGNLDAFKRLECSARLSDFGKKGARIEFLREGLGHWIGLPLTIGGFNFLVAEPKGHNAFGASIWFDPKVTYVRAAWLLMLMLVNRDTVQFMTSEGRKVTPKGP